MASAGDSSEFETAREFLQLIAVFRRIFSHRYCVSYTLQSTFDRFIHNNVQENPPEHRELLYKFPLNLKFLYAFGPRVRDSGV